LSIATLSTLPIYKSVILIRAPEASLKSLINLFKWPEEIALDHYVTRLATLAGYGGVLNDRAMVVEYYDLVDRSEETLAKLSRFFAVDRPFTNDYAKSKVTGKMGDPSKNILSGRIIRTREHEYSIRTEILDQAARAFRRCRNELLAAGVTAAVGQEALTSL
jgi:hypothetical protein